MSGSKVALVGLVLSREGLQKVHVKHVERVIRTINSKIYSGSAK